MEFVAFQSDCRQEQSARACRGGSCRKDVVDGRISRGRRGREGTRTGRKGESTVTWGREEPVGDGGWLASGDGPLAGGRCSAVARCLLPLEARPRTGCGAGASAGRACPKCCGAAPQFRGECPPEPHSAVSNPGIICRAIRDATECCRRQLIKAS